MPKIDGLEVCRRIRGKVTCPIIFLTAKVEEQDRVNGLLSGGDDYILKPFSLKELDARIIAHLKREERHKGKSEYRFHGDLSIDYGAKRVQIGENDLELTKLEYAIIEFLSMNPGQVFDRERIYEKVCGYDAEGDSRVVTELIRRVRKKLAEYTQTEYIETVWGWGIDGKDKKFILEKDNGFIYDTQLDCHFFLSVSIIEIAGQIQEEVWWKYVDQDEYYQAMNDRNENFEVVVLRPNQSKMSRMDWHISETCDFLQTYGVLLFLLPDVELRSACFTKIN